MKGILRSFIFQALALHLTILVMGESFNIGGGWETFALATFVLTLFNLLLKPILKLLFLPINALTLGLFSLVINAGVFYLFLLAVPQVTLTPWFFPGLSVTGFEIPVMQLSYVATLVVTSVVMSCVTNFFAFLAK